MKILHTSDWHIGRQFHNVSLLPDQAHVLAQVVDIAATQAVDVVIIAGDIYDRSVPPADAVTLLNDTLNQLCGELQLPVIIIAGNHDSPERIGFGAEQLHGAGLYVSGQMREELNPVVLQDEHGPVAFYSIPYAEPAIVRQCYQVEVSSHDQAMAHLCAQIQAHNSQYAPRRCVAISHCFLAGASVCESERPLSVGGADQVSASYFEPFNYTALGHLHGPQHKVHEHVRYSGSLLKYSFSEQHHQKSVTLVDLDAVGVCEISSIALKPLRDMRVLEGDLEQILEQGKTDVHVDDYLMVRLTDSHAILDVMGKLREVYPNVLHIERPGLQALSNTHQASSERLKKGEMAMFSDFFQQVSGEDLSELQSDLVKKMLQQLHAEEN